MLTACTNDDNTTEQQPCQTGAPVYYRVNIPATMGENGGQTRAVSYNSETGGLDATFRTTDNIRVCNKTKGLDAQDGDENYLLLHPDANGTTANLTGKLTFYDYTGYSHVDVNDVLVLAYNTDDYFMYQDDMFTGTKQSGTLDGLSSYDYASCEVSITGISGTGTADDPYELTTSKAEFKNAQSMYKLAFTGLSANAGVQTVTIHSASDKLVKTCSLTSYSAVNDDVMIELEVDADVGGDHIIYAALRFDPLDSETETDDIIFTVIDSEGRKYFATKTSPAGGFKNGKYYTSTIELKPEPKLGDIYYSDGTWSSTLNYDSATPIGVIAYLGTDEFTENGVTLRDNSTTLQSHGLVLCLKNAASDVVWSTNTTAQAYTGNDFVISRDDLKRTTGVSGYNATKAMATAESASLVYPAAYQAWNYTTLQAPAGTTGWFLPSAQQWVKMMTGLGRLSEDDICYWSWLDGNLSVATALENAFQKVKVGDYDYDSMSGWYWSSSEYSTDEAVGLIFGNSGIIITDDNKNPSGTSGFSIVRPVLAF